MIANPVCPTCGTIEYQTFGSRVYSRGAVSTATGWRQTALRILFEVWQPNVEEAEFKFVGCIHCGLMYYRPRPTEDEITAKYAFVGGMGDATPSKAEPRERTALRATRVFHILKPYLPVGARTIVDYGGGDGRLLTEFVQAGFDCGLIDHANNPIRGVHKLANTERELPADARFDIILCSHVVEHLGSPCDTLSRLRNCLPADGVMYVEVPYEVFDELPAKSEPVTHLNFFTPASLRYLLSEAGLHALKCSISTYPHPKGYTSLCVGAIAKRATGSVDRQPAGLAELQKAVAPSPAMRLAMRAYRKLKPRVDSLIRSSTGGAERLDRL